MKQRRIYFYRLDGRGKLYHDSSELKDPEFLDFFISRIRKNNTGEHLEFPYISVCNGEWNFIQPVTTIFVFRKLENGRLFYSPGLSVSFQPENLKVFQESIVHPAPLLGEWGSFSSELLLDFSKKIFQRENELIFEYLGSEFSILQKT